MLDIDFLNRYARQIVLNEIGLEGQEKISKARVAIIGLGGLGSPTALLLTSMGIGKLILVDRDVVSKTDLHRQPIYTEEDIDLPKVEVAARRLSMINSNVEFEVHPTIVSYETLSPIIKDVDLVMDGLDSMYARYIVNRLAVRYGKPYIHAGAIEMYGTVSTIIPYRTACLECIYGFIEDESDLPTCAQVGVHPSITFIIASIMVSEAIRIIIGREPLLAGKLLYFDLRTLEEEKIIVKRDETCPVCGSKPRDRAKPIKIQEVELDCARDGSGIYFVNKVVEDLDLFNVLDKIRRFGYRPLRITESSISFKIDDRLSATILKSGILIGKSKIHSNDTPQFFLKLHRDLVGR